MAVGNIACVKCGNGESAVYDSRGLDGTQIRRRRKCLKCEHRYTTFEILSSEYNDQRSKKRLLIMVNDISQILAKMAEQLKALPDEMPDTSNTPSAVRRRSYPEIT